jgi:hypothetical protein
MTLFSKRNVIVFLLAFASYSFFVCDLNNWNTLSRIGLTVNLVQNARLDIGGFSKLTEDKAYLNGKYYCDKAPGMSFLAVPVAYVFTRFARVSSNVDLDDEGPNPKRTTLLLLAYLCTVATSGLLTALAAVVLFGFIEKKTANWQAAAIGAATYALATPAWGWATYFFGHAAAGALLIIGFVLVDNLATGMDQKRDGRTIAALIFAAGLALGGAITVEFPSAVPVALILGYPAILNIRKQTFASALLITAAVGAVVAAAQIPLLLYNAAAFGAPFKLGYSNVVGFAAMKSGFFGIALPKFDVLAQILFGLRRGILWLSPLLVLAVAGTLESFRCEGGRARSALIVSIAVFYLLLNASYAYWDGGWSTGPRHITPVFPFLALGLGIWYARASSSFRTAILALLALSIVINLMCTSVTMTSPEKMANPLRELILPSFLRGDLDQTVPHAFFGAHGLWQLSPLLAAWLILGFAFLKTTVREKTTAAPVPAVPALQPAEL